MATAGEIVADFMRGWEIDKAHMKEAFRRYFTPTTVWENVGILKTVGIDEALPVIDQYEQSSGVVVWKTTMLALAEQGNKVLMERIDHLLDANGQEVSTIRVMGIFEVENDKIVAWRDYFDTYPVLSQPGVAEFYSGREILPVD